MYKDVIEAKYNISMDTRTLDSQLCDKSKPSGTVLSVMNICSGKDTLLLNRGVSQRAVCGERRSISDRLLHAHNNIAKSLSAADA